jgi:rfaE bifunctional protein nucleotidyltransferase chain/domain
MLSKLDKIISYQDLNQIVSSTPKNKTIVLATGVFDLLHQAHQEFLKKAKKAGDILFVGIETDTRVKQMKGLNRPIENQKTRLKKVSQLQIVDYVFLLPQKFDSPQDHETLIATVKPNILAVSSHTSFLKEKQKILKKYGGKVKIVLKKDESISTTKLVERSS